MFWSTNHLTLNKSFNILKFRMYSGKIISKFSKSSWALQVALVVKNPPADAGDARDMRLISWSGRSPEGGNVNHSSILAWRIPWTEEPGGLQSIVSQSQIQLKRLSMHTQNVTSFSFTVHDFFLEYIWAFNKLDKLVSSLVIWPGNKVENRETE